MSEIVLFFPFSDLYSETVHQDYIAAYYDHNCTLDVFMGFEKHTRVYVAAVSWNAYEEHLKRVTEII